MSYFFTRRGTKSGLESATEYRLGRLITQIVPFYRQKQKQHKEIITNNLLIIMAAIAIVKVTVLFLLPI